MNEIYGNIGRRLKGGAIALFVLEVIGAVIGGIVSLSEDYNLVGGLLLGGGPVVAMVSSWLLYALGELVEKTAQNEENTRRILKLLQDRGGEQEKKGSANNWEAPATQTYRRNVREEAAPQKPAAGDYELSEEYVARGEYDKALALKEQQYASDCANLGEEDPDTMATLGNLALCYMKAGQLEKALYLYEKLYDQRRRVLGEDHASTQKTKSRLEEVRTKLQIS